MPLGFQTSETFNLFQDLHWAGAWKYEVIICFQNYFLKDASTMALIDFFCSRSQVKAQFLEEAT